MPRGERSELRGVEEGVRERDTHVSELRARLKPKALCRSRWHWSWRAATLMRYNACLPAVPLERVHVYFAGGSWMRDCSARQARPCHLLSRWTTWSHRRCLKIWSRVHSRPRWSCKPAIFSSVRRGFACTRPGFRTSRSCRFSQTMVEQLADSGVTRRVQTALVRYRILYIVY